jgi:uncharacterized membrane protein YkvA (DUF1232 family)
VPGVGFADDFFMPPSAASELSEQLQHNAAQRTD